MSGGIQRAVGPGNDEFWNEVPGHSAVSESRVSFGQLTRLMPRLRARAKAVPLYAHYRRPEETSHITPLIAAENVLCLLGPPEIVSVRFRWARCQWPLWKVSKASVTGDRKDLAGWPQ
jgi:hypothetical protein